MPKTAAVVVRAPAEPLGQEPTLDELAATVRREHELCMGAMRTTIEHAVRAGEALLLARDLTSPDREWHRWLTANFPKHASTAYSYMRMARYQKMLPKDLNSVTAANELLRGLPAVDGGSPRDRVPDARKDDARRLRDQGASYKQIAKQLGASVSTVHYWFNDGTRLQKDKRARRALKKQEQERALRRAVNKTGGALSEAYSLAERMDDVLGQAHREATEPEARRELARAHEFQRAMRDSVVRALGVE